MSRNKKTLFRIIAAVAVVAIVAIFSHVVAPVWYVELLLYFAVYFLIAYDVVLEAIGGIGRGQLFDENFLMVLATVGAFVTGQYLEAVAVVLLYQVGELFQRYAIRKSRSSVSDLMELSPDTARVVHQGREEEVLSENVQIGDIVLVKPGERVPLDGIVIKGESALDSSALTGEAIPRMCVEGDEILSGVIVTNGVLEIRVTKAYYDSTAAKILELVENAAGKKAKTEKFITRFARYYTPVVVLLAVLLAVVPPLLGSDWRQWIGRAMNFLVVSCPCALVISIPMTFFSGIGAASRRGILVKGGNYLELLGKVNTFVFDKTGTLTEGCFAVTDVLPEERREEILHAAAVAECGSTHPIAHSILVAAEHAPEEGWIITERAGFGVRAEKDGCVIFVGNARYMEENGIEPEQMSADETVVYVARNGQRLGMIKMADNLKPDAKKMVANLRSLGVETIMLTGDREVTARQIAQQLEIEQYQAELLPGEKVQCLERIMAARKNSGLVAFVGDGINDAPVLMRADIGIAMGGIGSDAAIEAADVVLVHDRLSALCEAKQIAGRTIRIVWQNIIFALGVKLLVLALTPFGLVSIWLAIFADVGVAVLAILNAMRAGRA